MKKFKSLIPTVVCFTAVFLLAHSALSAADFDTGAITAEVNKIRGFLFGIGAKTVAIFSAVWGIIQSWASGTGKPLIIFGAIALASGFLPMFIDMVF